MVVGVKQECSVCGNEFTSCVKGGRCVECDVKWSMAKEAWSQVVRQMPPPLGRKQEEPTPPLDKTSEQEIRAASDKGGDAPPVKADAVMKCGIPEAKIWPVDEERPLTFQQIQAEIGRWSHDNFGDNVSKDETSISFGHPLGSIPALFGMQEELGELARAVARRHQGRGYEDLKDHREAKEDALSDLLVFMCDYATREGIDLMAVLNRVWQKVKLRRQESWVADKAREEAEARIYNQQTDVKFGGGIVTGLTNLPPKDPNENQSTEQDGHGFGHAPDAPT